VFEWQDIEGTCDTSQLLCQRVCTRSFFGICFRYGYQEYKLVGQDKECEITDECVSSKDIVDENGRYVSPVNLKNECETNHIVIFTDGDPNDVNLPDHNFNACSGSGKSDSYECQVAISNYLASENNYIGSPIKTHNVGLYMGSFSSIC
jgi:type IV pilus assembly protein PilY1